MSTGGLFCHDCSAKKCEVAGESGRQRVCNECYDELATEADPNLLSGGSPDLRSSIAGPARPVMPSQNVFAGLVGTGAAPLGPSPSKAPSWASQLPEYSAPPPASAAAPEPEEPEQEDKQKEANENSGGEGNRKKA